MKLLEHSWSASSSGSGRPSKIVVYIITTVLLTTAILSILFTLFVWNPHAWNLHLVHQCVVPNNNEARFPVEFADNSSYATLSPKSDQLWKDLASPNNGMAMKMNEQGERIPYGTAMFHQLHCLQEIRTALQTAINPSLKTEQNHASGNFHSEGVSWHILHCFDYMRHAILCMADDNYEPPKRTSWGGYLIEGISVHQCRDPTRLYQRALRDKDEIDRLMNTGPNSEELASAAEAN